MPSERPAKPLDLSHLPNGGWVEWTPCSKTCGYGTQSRKKYCSMGNGEFYLCYSQKAPCNAFQCDDMYYGQAWSECSALCGRGLRTREANNSIDGFQRIHCGMQSCTAVSAEQPTDIVFALGGSRSVGTDGWAISQQLVTDVTNGLELSDDNPKVGAMSFSNSYEIAVPIGQYASKQEFIDDVWDMEYPAGNALISEAVKGIVEMFRSNGREDSKKVAFIIIDGKTATSDDLELYLDQANEAGINIYIIGVGDRINMTELKTVAGGASKVLSAENFNQVPLYTEYLIDIATTGQPGGALIFPPTEDIPGAGWSSWYDCNTTCGYNGKQMRYQYCNQNSNTFYKCYTSTASCNTIPCEDPFHESEWTECSEPCGGGERTRVSRDLTTQRISCHNQPCDQYAGDCNVDIIFVLDSSGSIGSYNWYVTKQFVIDVILGMNANANMTRVGIITYSTTICREIELAAYTTDQLEQQIWKIDYMADATNTAGGLMMMREMFREHGRKDAAKIAILLTDGRSNIDNNQTIPEAEMAKAEGIDIYAVGVADIDDAEVNGIASDPDSRYVIRVDRFADLQSITQQIINVTCEDVLSCTEPSWGECSATVCGEVGVQLSTRLCTKISPTTGETVSEFEIMDQRPCNGACPSSTTTLEPTTTVVDTTTSTETTTSEPETTTSTETTTSEPETTTSTETTTSEPETTTSTETTTSEPETTTSTETTTSEPETTTSTETTTSEPETTTSTETTTSEPETTTSTETTTSEPETTTSTETTTSEPETTTSTETTTSEPETTTSTETTTSEPETTTTTETTTTETTTTETTTTETMTTDTTESSSTRRTTPWVPAEVDCDKCDFTMGQVWRPDEKNCHRFYVCEPTPVQGEYTVHHMTCGDLFWNQDIHTCVAEKPEGVICLDGDVVTANAGGQQNGACPFRPVAGSGRLYQTLEQQVLTCPQRMVFKGGELCGCYPKDIFIPVCTDDLLLHFPYDVDFNDITCHHAIGNMYGPGVVRIVNDTERGRVAWFDGARLEVAFLRMWFAQNEVDQFTVSLWFKRDGIQSGLVGLVNNGDCEEDPNFEVTASPNGIYSGVTTGTQTLTNKVQVQDAKWYHVAMVYNGNSVTMYLDGKEVSESASGFLRNPDCPMYVGFRSLAGYFHGYIDEVRSIVNIHTTL
ncbi:hypothetical protein LSAT2_001799 [Lamellibrachia satsuma]|nr:hypothetical protein LSAT2_001799 [Lamellibrachia satsuma]